MRLFLNTKQFIETDHGFDLSISIHEGINNVNAWYCDPVRIEPVKTDNFIGDTTQGGVVNFKNILINPHGNGTHTECVGHISIEKYTINQCLKSFHSLGRIITVKPIERWNEHFQETDFCIDAQLIRDQVTDWQDEKTLIVRTLENPTSKRVKQYSGSNPPYFTAEAMELINELGVDHLMVDLPSVDRESDEGKLICHHSFWNYPSNPLLHKTISELLYIPESVLDGKYVIGIQIISIESDASPSKIIAYPILESLP